MTRILADNKIFIHVCGSAVHKKYIYNNEEKKKVLFGQQKRKEKVKWLSTKCVLTLKASIGIGVYFIYL